MCIFARDEINLMQKWSLAKAMQPSLFLSNVCKWVILNSVCLSLTRFVFDLYYTYLSYS